ncbi:membrane protein [Bacillus sp. FJAT-27916]|uniref:AI-2E family transporter n=1 Tax=Bacillaceae TaxID=186817 RepID=UPI0006709BE6|nr:AI-2E family transporter [Bacillus sp. FJAT-27916]KMY45192.1 membrane protein [Bacillus sp. FJAT-27916]
MYSVNQLVKSRGFIRFLTFLILIILFYTLRDMINLILFTFIFIFLMGGLERFISSTLRKTLQFRVRPQLIILILYSVLITSMVMVIYKYIPIITMQLTELVQALIAFYKDPPDNRAIEVIISAMNKLISPTDIEQNASAIYTYAADIGKVSLQLFISILLSLFFLLEKEKIGRFTSTFKNSKLGTIFKELEHLGTVFVNSFGKVIEVQFLIASVNAVLSLIILYFLGFPQLLGLGIMIFLLGLIPVAGVIISLVPLCTIAYQIGEGMHVLYVIVLIAAIHALESYILNPKFMSAKTHLPTFYTFLVLVLAEHFLGIWGLILGIPIFIFILDMLEVPNISSSETKKEENKPVIE